MKKYQVYSKPDGSYLGMINQTLRVVEVADDEERHVNALQWLINQNSNQITIIPLGEHKKSEVVTLADIAPRKVPKKAKKRLMNTYLQGTPIFDFQGF